MIMPRFRTMEMEPTAAAGSTSNSSINSNRIGELFYRPPPLQICTTTKYFEDDEEQFTKTALHLLSRYEGLNLTVSEAIKSTLQCTEERAAFLEALLTIRQQHQQGKTTTSLDLIDTIYQTFGEELISICSQDKLNVEHPPKVPFLRSSSMPMEDNNCNGNSLGNDFHHYDKPMRPITTRHETTTTSLHPMDAFRGNRRRRCFFPDSEPKIRNIDWQLASAIQQVVSLSLDGTEPNNATTATNNNENNNHTHHPHHTSRYEPPTAMLM